MCDFIRHSMRLQCSNGACSHVFQYTDNEYFWWNDTGYVVLECPECHTQTRVRVYNVDGLEGHENYAGHYEDGEEACNEELAAVPIGESDEDTDAEDKTVSMPRVPVFMLGGQDIAEICKDVFQRNKTDLEARLKEIKDAYLAGQRYACDANRLLVKVHTDKEGAYCLLQKRVDSDKDYNTNNLTIIGHTSMRMSDAIDGVYTRDQCQTIVERELRRWSLLCRQVVFASPFIGLGIYGKHHYEETKNYWEWLNSLLDPHRTLFITRKRTFTSLKKAFKETGGNYNKLKEWGRLNELIAAAEDYKGAKGTGTVRLFEKFHAKFYAGIFDDHVEVLKGSHNIQTGDYLENLSVSLYSISDFEEKYLRPFGMTLPDAPAMDKVQQAGFIEISDKGVTADFLTDEQYYDMLKECL